MRMRLIRLRFRRRFRKGQQQVGDLGSQAEQHIDRHFLRRFERLGQVRRFLLSWLGLMILLIGGIVAQNLWLSNYYQQPGTIPGGVYKEGVLGRFSNANPIYATSDVDTTVSHLIFAGLFKYDATGKLVGDLASDYSVDSRGIVYTVHLKPNLTWQDGKPLTSSDVVFTYKTIQNPDAKSPLLSSWQKVEIASSGPRTVVFTLPGALASFADNLTNGIVPEHILSKITPVDLRSADFNTINPIGAGPFAWQAIQVTNDATPANAKEQIALKAFAGYQAGKPRLQEFVVQAFANQQQLIKAFGHKQLTAVEGLDSLPAQLKHDKIMIQHKLLLRAAKMVFFKTNSGVLADQTVRQSLVEAANAPYIIKQLDYTTRAVREPILLGQLGYDPSLAQAKFNPKEAATKLDAAGWKLGKNSIRYRDGKPLSFSLTLDNTVEDQMVAHLLQQQWQKVGAKVELQVLQGSEFQSSLAYHNYDAVLYGIAIGSDPDVFVYWNSSQADVRSANRLNLSEYKSSAADAALEAGRSRRDPLIRTIKYKPFLQAWQQDAPALGLYQPRLLYLTNGPVDGLVDNPINSPTDRFANVENWQIRQAKVTQ